jgi:AcrR family transcriptional regulator
MPTSGRPRTRGTDEAVVRAALELLGEGGYDAMTMEGVAARAGVAKTTVYRRWPSRADLLLEVARHLAAPVRVRPTGDLRNDLVAAIRDAMRVLESPAARRAIPRVLAEAHESEELATLLAAFWAERRGKLMALLEAGVRDGQIAADLDRGSAVDALYGPIWYRFLVTRAPLTRRVAEAIVDTALDGLRRA